MSCFRGSSLRKANFMNPLVNVGELSKRAKTQKFIFQAYLLLFYTNLSDRVLFFSSYS